MCRSISRIIVCLLLLGSTVHPPALERSNAALWTECKNAFKSEALPASAIEAYLGEGPTAEQEARALRRSEKFLWRAGSKRPRWVAAVAALWSMLTPYANIAQTSDAPNPQTVSPIAPPPVARAPGLP